MITHFRTFLNEFVSPFKKLLSFSASLGDVYALDFGHDIHLNKILRVLYSYFHSALHMARCVSAVEVSLIPPLQNRSYVKNSIIEYEYR